ncbi:hypothetical protein BV22DRAFT_1025234, partial [Leucogyrophana mollusca]
LNNHQHTKCLRAKHDMSTVGDLERIANRNNRTHRQKPSCKCHDCKSDRNDLRCTHPHKRKKMAHRIVTYLLPKWNPLTTTSPQGRI